MSSELSSAIQQIAEEKNLSVESIKETVELALAAAYRKDFGNKLQNIKVDFDIDTSESRVYDVKTVVNDDLVEEYLAEQETKRLAAEENKQQPPETPTSSGVIRTELPQFESKPTEQDRISEEEIKFNPKTMIGLTDAQELQADIKKGEELRQELEVPQAYGRMAAQTAKQVIIQKIREAERENIYQLFKEREYELISGMVQRVEPKVVLIDIDKTTAIMPVSEQVESDHYRVGNRMKFYIKEVNQTPKGPEIIVSRNHPEMIRKLFSIEVPEISSNSVVIKSIAREAGSRSKIAVTSKEENVDPIGACVGQRGTRVQTIINELGGEKIDIIEFSEDQSTFISNALSPAKVIRVEINESEKHAQVLVREDQLSLAIGKGGQNVRLAARLTGWRLDIVEDKTGELKSTSDEDGEKQTNKETSEQEPKSSQTETKLDETKKQSNKTPETNDSEKDVVEEENAVEQPEDDQTEKTAKPEKEDSNK